MRASQQNIAFHEANVCTANPVRQGYTAESWLAEPMMGLILISVRIGFT